MFLSLTQKDTVISRIIENAIKSVETVSESWHKETIRLTAEVQQARKDGINEGKKTGRRQGATGILLGIIACLLIYYYVKSKL